MTCGDNAYYINPTVAFIRACALNWWVYKKWEVGDVHIRGFQMKQNMKDIVLAGALYTVARRKQRNLV